MSVKGGVSTVPDLRYVPGDRRYTVAELDVLAAQTKNEIHGFQRKAQANDLTLTEVIAVEGLVAAFNAITDTIAVTEAAAEEPPVAMMTADDERELWTRAYHEAGHAIALVASGGLVERGYVLPPGRTESDGAFGRVIAAAMPLGDAVAHFAYAGPWAETRWSTGKAWPSPQAMAAAFAGSGRLDKAMCRGVATEGREVVPLMDRCWPAVVRVAEKLVADGEVNHAHVTAALGLSEDASRHPFELASLRAGMRAVVPR